MSTREIAELTKKDHANVLRDARNMLEELGKDAFSFEGIYLDAYGREKPCINLPKDLTFTLVAGYSAKMRHAIVVRWQELEAQAARGTNTKNIALDGLSVVRLPRREKIAAGIGVLNGAVKSCLAHTVVCSFFASSAQFLAARTRGDESHRRCSIGTPTSSRAASPIGVGRR